MQMENSEQLDEQFSELLNDISDGLHRKYQKMEDHLRQLIRALPELRYAEFEKAKEFYLSGDVKALSYISKFLNSSYPKTKE